MLKSPSKHTSLAKLKQLRADNYIGANGVEYCVFEVEALINEKEQAQAMVLVEKANKAQESLASRKAINDKIKVQKKLVFKIDRSVYLVDQELVSARKRSMPLWWLF